MAAMITAMMAPSWRCIAMTCACLVPVRWAGSFGVASLTECSLTATTVFTITGLIPMVHNTASVALRELVAKHRRGDFVALP